MRGSVIGNRGAGVVIDFNRHTAGVIGEKVRERRGIQPAGDGKAELPHVPGRVGGGVGHVQGEMFETHAGRSDPASRRGVTQGSRRE